MFVVLLYGSSFLRLVFASLRSHFFCYPVLSQLLVSFLPGFDAFVAVLPFVFLCFLVHYIHSSLNKNTFLYKWLWYKYFHTEQSLLLFLFSLILSLSLLLLLLILLFLFSLFIHVHPVLVVILALTPLFLPSHYKLFLLYLSLSTPAGSQQT